MFPVIVFSIRWGLLPGVVIGSLYGIVTLIANPFVIPPAQLILDYPLPYAYVGFSGISYMRDKTKFVGYIPFIVLSYILKFECHYLSGIVFFKSYAPKDTSPYIYSLLNNIQTNAPELIIFITVLALLWNQLRGVLKTNLANI